MAKERSESNAKEPDDRSRGLSGIQKILLVLSLVLTAGGVVLMLTTGIGGEPEPAAPGTVDPALLAQGFAPGGDTGASSESAPGGGFDPWGPTIFRLGFSFFVAFAIGFALRAFIRLSLVYLGLVFLTVLGLSWLGWVEIHWAAPSEQFDALASGLREQFESFRAFLQGSLPAAGLAGLGLFTGLRKK